MIVDDTGFEYLFVLQVETTNEVVEAVVEEEVAVVV